MHEPMVHKVNRTIGGGPGVGAAQTVRKALAILDVLAAAPEDLGLTALSRRLAMNKATTYRLASALQAAGLIEQDPATAGYRLGLKLLYLASRTLDHMALPRVAHAALVDLCQATGESPRLGVLDGDEVVYIDGMDSPQPVRFVYRSGSRAPVHASSIGKVLFAYLDPAQLAARVAALPLPPYTPHTIVDRQQFLAVLEQVRAAGYAVNEEEYHVGVASVAAPIFDPAGRVIAGLGVAGPSYRLIGEARAAAVAAVQAAAREVTRRLQGKIADE